MERAGSAAPSIEPSYNPSMYSSRVRFAWAYAVSGAAALIYEISWTRLLSLQIGHSIAAATTVLAAYMAGLATGAWVGGSVDRRLAGTRALRTRLLAYGALELLIASWAIALPMILRAFVPLLVWAYHDAIGMWRFEIVNVLLSVAVLAPPTIAMGATFPLAAAWMAEARSAAGLSRQGDAAATAGVVYAANTAGAFVGALAAGLWLIPGIGIRATTLVGAALNVGAAAVALLIAREQHAPEGVPSSRPISHRTVLAGTKARAKAAERGRALPPKLAAETTGDWSRRSLALGSAAAGISGLLALVYEVAWTRLLALVIGPTTYAFTLVVASFIVGIAAGSAGAARLVKRTADPSWWLAAMVFVTAVAASGAAWFAAVRLPVVIASSVAAPNVAFQEILATQAIWALLLLIPMSCALGAVFPLAVAVATPGGARLGTVAATVYFWNTAGAIAGALLGGFVLLPRVGLYETFRAAAATGIIAALAVWWLARPVGGPARGRLSTAAAALAGLVFVLVMPGWDLNLLASGAYKYSPYGKEDPISEFKTWRMVSYEDGGGATVGVRELAGMRSLVIDGKVDASNMGDMLTQRLLGLLPVILHPNPQQVCVIGLGSGVTAASTLARGTVRNVDIVEI
jgi:spermidine synthase